MTLLELDKLSLDFGGLRALHELDLRVGEGEIVSLIGPNGAGKTTGFNVITGLYEPTGGAVRFDGQSLARLKPHQVTQRGIARTFQSLRVFLNTTVFENVITATYGGTKATPLEQIFRLPRARREEREIRAQAEEILSFFGQRLAGYRGNQPAYSLSYANRRRLEIARALATKPRLLLFDELLEGISIEVGTGELVCLLGGNASGKSTTLKTILGLVKPRAGRVLLAGEDVTTWPVPQRIANGMAIVPENRRLFGDMTVRENLELGATLSDGKTFEEDLDRVHTLFPRLQEREGQLAGTLSGGEQQMVAMGRALMSRPRLLLMDEPSMGLSPALVQQNFRIIKEVHESGVSVLMVEQNATMALSIADRGYVLSTGQIVLEGAASELLKSEDLKRAYLGR